MLPLLLFGAMSVPDAAPRTQDDLADEYDNRVTRTVVRYQDGRAVTAAYYAPGGSMEAMEFFSNDHLDSAYLYESPGEPTERRLIRHEAGTAAALTLITASGMESFTDLGKIDSIMNGPPARTEAHIQSVIVRNRNVQNQVFHRYFGRDPAKQGPLTARIRVLPDGTVDRAVLLNKANPGRDFYAEILRIVRAMQFDPCSDCAPSTLTVTIEFSAAGAGQPLPDRPRISRTKQVVLGVTGVIAIGALVWVFLRLDKKNR